MASAAAADEPITKLPPIDQLASLPWDAQCAVLDLLFEPSTALHDLAQPILVADAAAPQHLYTSYDEFIGLVGEGMRTLADSPAREHRDVLDGILCAHPRLGEKKVESAMSRMEQAAMAGRNEQEEETEDEIKRKEEEAEMLRRLNAEYEEAYPGLIYTVFVNGRSRPVIMEDMKKRIARGDRQAERRDAIEVGGCSSIRCSDVVDGD